MKSVGSHKRREKKGRRGGNASNGVIRPLMGYRLSVQTSVLLLLGEETVRIAAEGRIFTLTAKGEKMPAGKNWGIFTSEHFAMECGHLLRTQIGMKIILS